MANIQSHFDKYLRKTSVQQGLVEEIGAMVLQHAMLLDHIPTCHYRHQVLFVNQLTQEAKVALYTSKTKLIQMIQKKLLEHHHLNIIIKDIRIGKL